MDKKDLDNEISEFCNSKHGSSDYDTDHYFVLGDDSDKFAPLRYITKKPDIVNDIKELLQSGYILDSLNFLPNPKFNNWFESQFSRKLLKKEEKKIFILREPNNKSIFDSIENVHKCYALLREESVILNGKNLPIQLGEWYAKSIFGLEQRKSTSQRGFDFYIGDKRVEIKISWSDQTSAKGIKLRKSLVDLSDYCVIMYVARNFRIREVCFLDSTFIMRKFDVKGDTIFLKDSDIRDYFFSNSFRHKDKVVNMNALMKYATPQLAIKLV